MTGAVAWLLSHPGPQVLFTGRSPVPDLDVTFEFNQIKPVTGSGRDCYLFATGNEVAQAIEAESILGNGYGVEVTVFNVSTLSPIDVFTLGRLAQECHLWFTVEDHSYSAGLHGAIAEVAVQLPRPPRVVPIAVSGWGESGEADELRARFGLDGQGIAKRVLEEL
jgi:transketolase